MCFFVSVMDMATWAEGGVPLHLSVNELRKLTTKRLETQV